MSFVSYGAAFAAGATLAYCFDPDLHFSWPGILNRHISKAECQGMD